MTSNGSGLAQTPAAGKHQEGWIGVRPHPKGRSPSREFLRSRQCIQLIFQISLRVRELGRLTIEGARLEGLALQRGIEHQQSRHANAEDPNQHQKEGKSSQAGGWFLHCTKGPTVRSALVTAAR